MKKAILALATVALMGSCAETPEVIDASTVEKNYSALEDYEKTIGAAEIVFNEMEYDFGKVIQGDKVSHTFYFVNSGDQPLVLGDVRGSCGCTIPNYPTEAIAPGEKGQIDVVVNTERKSLGKHFKVYVYVPSNGKTPDHKLMVRGIPVEKMVN